MAKTVKKTKSNSKSAVKTLAKPAKKQVKAAAPVAAKKPAAKLPSKKAAVEKPVAVPTKAAAQKKPVVEKAPAAAKSAKAKVDNKAKKNKREEEIEDDLMVSDEDIGGEEIPDLSDFEVDEEIEEETIEIEIEETVGVVAGSSQPSDADAILTDAEGRPYCKVRDCDQIAAVDGYCRYHYLLLWKKIQIRRRILIDGKLERYVEELTARYPDKFLEMIKRDLRTEKDFMAAIAELEIDESAGDGDFDDESQVLDEVRGFGSESSMSDDDEF